MKRCAIYTRKSSAEGLDQKFNSLDSQREAAEHYIKAQAHQEWDLIPEIYSDGGYSGGTTERPGLQKLLRDIQDKKIDVVAVYKIDRLSRSMADFIKIMEIFDAHNVTFVSITQYFDTNTSMGKLLLNILQSFSQFERDMTTERILDKIDASKKKGMWMGGPPPLGYDIHEKKLIRSPDEEKIIKFIFDEFSTHGSVTELVKNLKNQGLKTKTWVSAKGRIRQGTHIEKGTLYRILKNVIYIGQIKHKDAVYEGEHEPIICREQFSLVQEKLKNNAKDNPLSTDIPYLLKGLVFDSDGYAMTCAASKKPGSRYRYYTSTCSIKKSYGDSTIKPIPAKILEDTIINLIKKCSKNNKLLHSPSEIKNREFSFENLFKNFGDFALLWDELSLSEQQAAINSLIKKITIHTDKIEITFYDTQMIRFLDQKISHHKSANDFHTYEMPIKFKIVKGRRYIEILSYKKSAKNSFAPEEKDVLEAVAKGFLFLKKMNDDPNVSFSELAKKEAIDPSNLAKYIRLTQLSPKIIQSIVQNNQPYHLTAQTLLKSFPDNWDDQESLFGF